MGILRFVLRTPAPGWVLMFVAALAPLLAAAQSPMPSEAVPARANAQSDLPLTMQEAVRLSLIDQPLLQGREAKIRAEDQQAIAASQLPDPRLTGALKELPIDTPEAFSVRRDNFTEFTVGLSQDFPRAEKRRLSGERKRLEADADRATLDNEQRIVRRETSLAWLDLYEAQQALTLTQGLNNEAGLQVRALEKDYTNGKASQADWFAAKVDAGLIEDKAHDWLHHLQRMRAALARWIGDEARRPLADTLPALESPNTLPTLLAGADHHPVIGTLDKQIEAAATEVALARQSYKPDYSVEVYFAYRPDFADFVGIQFSVPLPFFTKNRQDRDLAAALEQSHASEDRKLDVLRELHTEIRQDHVDRQHYQERVGEFDASIIPDAQRRFEAARATYGSARGAFDTVLLARRGLLEVQLQRLALAVEAARSQVRLDYWSASEASGSETP